MGSISQATELLDVDPLGPTQTECCGKNTFPIHLNGGAVFWLPPCDRQGVPIQRSDRPNSSAVRLKCHWNWCYPGGVHEPNYDTLTWFHVPSFMPNHILLPSRDVGTIRDIRWGRVFDCRFTARPWAGHLSRLYPASWQQRQFKTKTCSVSFNVTHMLQELLHPRCTVVHAGVNSKCL